MATVVTPSAETPGRGANRPLFFRGPRAAGIWTGSIAFDDSYPTGGEAFDAEANSGFSDVIQVSVDPIAGYVFQYVDSATAANRKIKVFKDSQRLTAAVNPGSLATDVSEDVAVTVTGAATTDDVFVIPPADLETGLVYQGATVTGANTVTVRVSNVSAGTIDGASKTATFILRPKAGTMVEVANTTDLSALTAVNIRVIGYR